MRNRTVVLVTHHVELVLPGTYYLVRMLDGRIDVQGTVKDLRSSGMLDNITLEAAVEETEGKEKKLEEEKKDEITEVAPPEPDANGAQETDATAKKEKKKPKKKKSTKFSIYITLPSPSPSPSHYSSS